jgi:hypothetical protein
MACRKIPYTKEQEFFEASSEIHARIREITALLRDLDRLATQQGRE